MGAPTFVGSTLLDPVDGWSTSYTIDSSSIPAGASDGDLLLLFFMGATPSPASGRWGLSSTWKEAGPSASPVVGNAYVASHSGLAPFIRCLFARVGDSGLFPQTVYPTDSSEGLITGTANSGWRALLVAYDNAADPSARGVARAYNADRYLPGSPPGAYTGSGTNFTVPTTTVALGGFGTFSFGTSNASTGFTTQGYWANTTRRVPMLLMDRQRPTGSDSFTPRWQRGGTGPSNLGPYATSFELALPQKAAAGWSVGLVRY